MEKDKGIKAMMDMLDAPYEDVVVFGDGLNDVSMFIPEWTSIAMGNAREVLKQRADYVTAATTTAFAKPARSSDGCDAIMGKLSNAWHHSCTITRHKAVVMAIASAWAFTVRG